MADVSATRLAAEVETHTTLLLDSLEGLLASAQTTESLRNTQERLQLRLHAARLEESAHVLANVTCVLQRDALLADFASRVRAVQEAVKAAEEERQEAVETLGERAAELVRHLQEQGAERTVLTRIGDELVAEDMDAPDDPQGIARRLYEIAEQN